jgi:hypothetical protein
MKVKFNPFTGKFDIVNSVVTDTNIYTIDGTLTGNRNVDLSTFGLTFSTSIFSMQGANGRVGVGTANAYTGQVTYTSNATYASYFVIRTASDRYGWNHNNGTVEFNTYIASNLFALGTTTNHPFYFYINDTYIGGFNTNGNFVVGVTGALDGRIGARGATSDNASNVFLGQNQGGANRVKLSSEGRFRLFNGNATSIAAHLNSFDFYSADIVEGNAAPHFQTENGDILKLYKQAALTAEDGTLANAVIRISEIETTLTNLGLI